MLHPRCTEACDALASSLCSRAENSFPLRVAVFTRCEVAAVCYRIAKVFSVFLQISPSVALCRYMHLFLELFIANFDVTVVVDVEVSESVTLILIF